MVAVELSQADKGSLIFPNSGLGVYGWRLGDNLLVKFDSFLGVDWGELLSLAHPLGVALRHCDCVLRGCCWLKGDDCKLRVPGRSRWYGKVVADMAREMDAVGIGYSVGKQSWLQLSKSNLDGCPPPHHQSTPARSAR